MKFPNMVRISYKIIGHPRISFWSMWIFLLFFSYYGEAPIILNNFSISSFHSETYLDLHRLAHDNKQANKKMISMCFLLNVFFCIPSWVSKSVVIECGFNVRTILFIKLPWIFRLFYPFRTESLHVFALLAEPEENGIPEIGVFV